MEVELSKLQHNNKKMSLEMKALKEDSQYITSRIQKLSKSAYECRGRAGDGEANPGSDDSGVWKPRPDGSEQEEQE